MLAHVQLFDPTALDSIEGPHGKMTIELPASELGKAVAIDVPKRLVCARCDGGGCDACGRSGALKLEQTGSTSLVLPPNGSEQLLLRIPHPLGEAANLALLTVQIRLLPAKPSLSYPFIIVLVLIAVGAAVARFVLG